MNFIDKLIEVISPQRAFERQKFRSALDAQRSYDAGRVDRLGGGWVAVNSTAEQIDAVFRDRLRARARDLERNNDIVESIVAGIVRNVVGKGFTLQARTADEELNTLIENRWKRWRRARNCDITGRSSFGEILALLMRRMIYDGEILAVKVYDSAAKVPFKLQLREADDLDTSITAAPNGNVIQGGVELNSYSKPVAYWFYERKPDGFSTHKSIRIEAQRVIHLFSKTRPTQVRGISQLARSMDRMRDTNEYLEAERVKARIAACLAVFVETNAPQ
nr:phage portal protein [Negativicutes bacterium]